jgi:hypothetical protein
VTGRKKQPTKVSFKDAKKFNHFFQRPQGTIPKTIFSQNITKKNTLFLKLFTSFENFHKGQLGANNNTI